MKVQKNETYKMEENICFPSHFSSFCNLKTPPWVCTLFTSLESQSKSTKTQGISHSQQVKKEKIFLKSHGNKAQANKPHISDHKPYHFSNPPLFPTIASRVVLVFC
jgi:hypothetical protein